MSSNRRAEYARQRLYEVGRTEWRQPQARAGSESHFVLRHLRFFTNDESPSLTDQQPGKRFAQSCTQFIGFQVEMVNPWRNTRWTYRLTARLYHPDGSLMGEMHDRVTVEAACETFCYTGQWGADACGAWSPGGYRVEVCVDEQATVTGNFAIAADLQTQLRVLQRRFRPVGLG
jgi:hypothetical protein